MFVRTCAKTQDTFADDRATIQNEYNRTAPIGHLKWKTTEEDSTLTPLITSADFLYDMVEA